MSAGARVVVVVVVVVAVFRSSFLCLIAFPGNNRWQPPSEPTKPGKQRCPIAQKIRQTLIAVRVRVRVTARVCACVWMCVCARGVCCPQLANLTVPRIDSKLIGYPSANKSKGQSVPQGARKRERRREKEKHKTLENAAAAALPKIISFFAES